MNIKTDSNLNIANDNEFNKKQIVVLLMFTILGVSIGWLGFLLFGDIGNQCKIIYVSQKEILRLEKERINKQPKEKNLFFGKVNQAIELINSEAQKYKDKRSKVIFVVGDFITGEGTVSISKQVHQSVIEHLAKLLGNLEQGKLSDRLEDNRPLRKLAYAEEFEGDAERRTAAYLSVREDSSTASTYKLPAEVEFPKRSNNLGGVTIDRQPQLLNSNHQNNKQLNNNQ